MFVKKKPQYEWTGRWNKHCACSLRVRNVEEGTLYDVDVGYIGNQEDASEKLKYSLPIIPNINGSVCGIRFPLSEPHFYH